MSATALVLFALLPLAQATPTPRSDTSLQDRHLGIGVGAALDPLFAGPGLGRAPVSRFSLRLQLSDRFALEPSTVLRFDGVTSSDDARTRSQQVGVDLGARFYAVQRGPLHLVGLAGTGVGHAASRATTPQAEVLASATEAHLSAGLGVEWTPSPRWALGLDLQNPLLQVSRATAETSGATASSTAWSTGLASRPQVAAMAHLYF